MSNFARYFTKLGGSLIISRAAEADLELCTEFALMRAHNPAQHPKKFRYFVPREAGGEDLGETATKTAMDVKDLGETATKA